MSYGRHRAPRAPRWHDRPRAWLRHKWNRARGEYDEEYEPVDDNGEPLDDLIDDYEYDDEPAVIRTARVGDTYLPLSGEPGHPDFDRRFWGETYGQPGEPTENVPRPVVSAEQSSGVVGPGHLDEAPAFTPDVPRPGTNDALRNTQETGPGYLSAFMVPFGAAGHYPQTPRPAPRPIILWRPRECGGRITVAGAW